MKITKFILISITITAFSLFYVWQQTEIFRLAYKADKNSAYLEDLLDKNTVLRYNTSKRTSLASIGEKVYNTNGYQMPDGIRMVRATQPAQAAFASQQPPSKIGLLANLFGVKRQAEAETITDSFLQGYNW